MKTRLHHPLWLHIPSTVALAAFVWVLVSTPLPDRAPVHFGIDGTADNWGSPLAVALLLLVLSAIFIALSAFMCELWAREEQKKTFNPLSLIDDVTVAAMAAMGVEYLHMVIAGGNTFPLPWNTILLFAGTATVAAALLERLRPYKHYEHQLDRVDTRDFRKELESRLASDQPLVYWESQNPKWMTVIFVLVPSTMYVGAVSTLASEARWVSILLFAVGTLMLLLIGGIRTTVTRERVTVRLGTPGFRVLSLATTDIASVEMREFAPLKEFGGYGVRQNREMKAYYLRGRTGALLTTRDGKRHLIGSDNPERLTTIIEAVSRRG